MIIEKICSHRTESRRDDIFHPFGVMNIARPDFYNHHTPSGLLKFNCVTPNNAKEFEMFISTLVLDEIENNTYDILLKNMFNLIKLLSVSVLETNDEILKLADIYRKYILPKEVNDTIHIAIASYYGLDAIVSWNFRHIVNLKTMKAINDVNLKHDYPIIQILTIENLGGDQYGTL